MHTEQALAARAVARVLDGGANLAEALAAVDDGSELRGRALVQELAYGTLRHWGTLDALVRKLSRNPLPDALLRSLTAVALYQIAHTRAPAFAVVDHAVDAAAQLVRPAAKSLVNALLRRLPARARCAARGRARRPVARWSYPSWWIDRVRRDYPARLGGDARGRQRAPAACAARQSQRVDDARRAARALRRRRGSRRRGRRLRASSSLCRGR